MKTIIIQDTDPGILDMLTLALTEENFKVHAIKDPSHDFLTLIEQTRPHVVMLDYKINGEAAIEILHQIKKLHPFLPVIAISCNSGINGLALKAGFNDYIPKPFDLSLLYTILRKHIKKDI